MDNLSFLQHLRSWIRAVYLRKDAIQQLQQSFSHDAFLAHLQLHDFFSQSHATTILHHLKKASASPVSIPDRHHYEQLTSSALEPFLHFLRSPVFRQYLELITSFQLDDIPAIQIVRFRAGDYTLLHDADVYSDALFATLDLTPLWDVDFGGSDFYLYKTEAPLILSPGMNTFTLVRCTPQTQRFTKYVNHLASCHERICIRMTWQLKKS